VWSEIDLVKAVWSVPEQRTRCAGRTPSPWRRRPSLYFETFQVITGRSRLVFPDVRSNSRPLSENTLNAALRRLGYGVDER
jgi:hypothetical protein